MDVQGDDDADTEEPTDETVKTEHEVTDAQQVDTAQGVAGTSEEQRGKEVCLCVLISFLFSANFCYRNMQVAEASTINAVIC